MFDGKMFFPVTGIPMRKIACMRSPLALAEPVPLTVPILNAKSFTPLIRLTWPAYGSLRSKVRMSHAAVGQRSAQSPQCRQTSSSLTMTRFVWGSASET